MWNNLKAEIKFYDYVNRAFAGLDRTDVAVNLGRHLFSEYKLIFIFSTTKSKKTFSKSLKSYSS